MSKQTKILAFAGSLRQYAYSKRVLQVAIDGAKHAGADVTFLDLNEFPIPIFNADDVKKKGFDPLVLQLQNLLSESHGLLIATPSYNGSIPAAFKIVIDWMSRPNYQFKKEDLFIGKTAGILSSSPGSLGGVRALAHLRGVLTSVNVNVIPLEIAVPFVANKFNGDSYEINEKQTQEALENFGKNVVNAVYKSKL
ncbi:MAG: NAD(P)H-dependent oxidoreductase [Chloroflexota bacterium]